MTLKKVRFGHPPNQDNKWLLLLLALILTCFMTVATCCPVSCTCLASRKGGYRLQELNGTSIEGAPIVVSCTNARLSRVPLAKDFKNIEDIVELDLSKNIIEKIGKDFFAGFWSLTDLKISGNRISFIAEGALTGIPLKTLYLDANRLHNLSRNLFAESLENLSLKRNFFVHIPISSLSQLPNLLTLNLAQNAISVIRDNDFSGLFSLLELSLRNNKISKIHPKALSDLLSLKILDLSDNLLKEVPEAIGLSLWLQTLFLANNKISFVASNAFQGLLYVQYIDLENNPLLQVDIHSFVGLPSLRKLKLKEVRMLEVVPSLNGTSSLEEVRIDRANLSVFPENFCLQAPRIVSLNLHLNRLTSIPHLKMCNHMKLLDLSSNAISGISSESFSGLDNLQDLILHSNQITDIPADAFVHLVKLQVLNLENNRISYIHHESFLPLVSLKDINFGNNEFVEFPSTGLERIHNLKVHNNPNLKVFPDPENFPHVHTLVLSYAYHCCPFLNLERYSDEESNHQLTEEVIFSDRDLGILWNATGQWPEFGANADFEEIWNNLAAEFLPSSSAASPVHLDDSHIHQPRVSVYCIPQPGSFMPCKDLFDWWALRCGVWIVFLLALLGNGTVVVVLIFARTKMDVPRFLVTNLAMADFFMGIYLGFLAVIDASTLGEFRMYAIPWQMSPGCQTAGFFGVLSSELSVYTLAVITLERNYAITHAMHLNKRLSLRHAAYIMVVGWLFSLTMAVLPIVGISDYRKFAVCLPFETKGGGLLYVVFLMFINGVAFLVLMGCYLKIYCSIRGSQAWNSNDSRIAKRMALLVFTDLLCWAPIAFFSLTAAFGFQFISLEEAKVFTVFILPLNSCCNPFLYALLTKQFKKDCVMLCKSIEESGVTRGIGRCRHSSNFSNRQTPVNTNSALDQTSKGDNAACSCKVKQTEPQNFYIRLKKSLITYVLCRKGKEGRRSISNFAVQQPKGAAKAQRNTSVSSETYSSSWSDSWKKVHAPMTLRLFDKRKQEAWYLSRKPSQESNLSSSRNDSSGTSASTSTWRISRSSVSSDISSAGSRGKNEALSVVLLNSLKERSLKTNCFALPQHLGENSQFTRCKPKLQRQSAVEKETYFPYKGSNNEGSLCPLHQRQDNLSCVYEQESFEEEEQIQSLTETQMAFLAPSYQIAGLALGILPSKLSTISSHSVNAVSNLEKEESKFGSIENASRNINGKLSVPDSRMTKCTSLTFLPKSPSAQVCSSSRCQSDGLLGKVSKFSTPFILLSGEDREASLDSEADEVFISEPQNNKVLETHFPLEDQSLESDPLI